MTNRVFSSYKALRSPAQRGMTLVELLVALVLGSLIVLAAIAALTVSRRGFTTVDASSQLRDNGRFATSIIRRIVTQAGYLDFKYASTTAAAAFQMGGPSANEVEPNIKGFNNAEWSQNLVIGMTNTPSVKGLNDSDMLVIRFQAGSVTMADGSEKADFSMIDCAGNRVGSTAISYTDRITSVFYVTKSQGEPALMCGWRNDTTGSWSNQPLVQGVESLQLLYGVDGVTPGAAPTLPTDSVPERYLRADELVAPTEAATNANWARVRSIRVGLVIRGPVGSAPELSVPEQYPLGAKGVMNSPGDLGSFVPEKTDGRLRQSVTFTIHLRNSQDTI